MWSHNIKLLSRIEQAIAVEVSAVFSIDISVSQFFGTYEL